MVAEALTMTGSLHDLPKVPECHLSTDLGSLLETGNFSDVTLAVGEKEFKAHKAILSGVREWPTSREEAIMLPTSALCVV